MVVNDIGYGLFIICSLHIGYIWLMKGQEIYKDLKGDNFRWEAPELLILFAIVIWAPLILADAFFGFEASDKAWVSLEYVVGFALAGKVFLKWVSVKETKKEDAPKYTPDQPKDLPHD